MHVDELQLLQDQEIALTKAIVALNPHLRSLSTEAAEMVADCKCEYLIENNSCLYHVNNRVPSYKLQLLATAIKFAVRDRVQETLYNVVRESHPKEIASSRFGNLLLFLRMLFIIDHLD